VQLIVTGAINGSRHITQRVVTSWMTNDRYKIMPALDWTTDLELGNVSYPEEYTVATTPEGIEGELLRAPANPVLDAPAARVTMRFLGRDASDPRAAGVIVGADPADLPGATQTCRNIADAIEAVLPLSFPNPQVCPCPNGQACN
jgi:hypothetical protein